MTSVTTGPRPAKPGPAGTSSGRRPWPHRAKPCWPPCPRPTPFRRGGAPPRTLTSATSASPRASASTCARGGSALALSLREPRVPAGQLPGQARSPACCAGSPRPSLLVGSGPRVRAMRAAGSRSRSSVERSSSSCRSSEPWRAGSPGRCNTPRTPDWVGTTIVFDVAAAGDGAMLRFRHQGLTPERECYDMCDAGWTYYRGSLASYVELSQKAAADPGDSSAAINDRSRRCPTPWGPLRARRKARAPGGDRPQVRPRPAAPST